MDCAGVSRPWCCAADHAQSVGDAGTLLTASAAASHMVVYMCGHPVSSNPLKRGWRECVCTYSHSLYPQHGSSYIGLGSQPKQQERPLAAAATRPVTHLEPPYNVLVRDSQT